MVDSVLKLLGMTSFASVHQVSLIFLMAVYAALYLHRSSVAIHSWLNFVSLGWKGDTCEENVDECENSPCENGGMCMDMPGNFLCGCPMGRFENR